MWSKKEETGKGRWSLELQRSVELKKGKPKNGILGELCRRKRPAGISWVNDMNRNNQRERQIPEFTEGVL